MTENEEWLAVAESAFSDWDSPEDDDIEFWVDVGRQSAEHGRQVARALAKHLALELDAAIMDGVIGG